MNTQPGAQVSKTRVTSGIVFTVLSGFSFALTGFVANTLVDDGHPGVVIGFYEAAFGLTLVLAVNARSLRGRPKATRAAWGWTALAGAAFATAFATFYTALSTLDYSVGSPVLGAIPLVSYIFVLVLLRGQERITPRALVGATLVVVGVGIIGAVS